VRGSVVEGLRGEATKEHLFAAGIDNFAAAILCVVTAAKLPGALSSISRWLIACTIYLLYFLFQEGFWGTTVGKREFGLLVVRLDGRPAGWAESLGCTALRILEVNPLLIGTPPGGLAVTWTKRKQRLGDMLAGTVVVHRRVLAETITPR
jgi:uncharacterized RDD family membrane protein YckC